MGGGGGGGGGGNGPGGGTAPFAALPLATGKRWLYDLEKTGSVSTRSGASTSRFRGEVILHVGTEVTEAGRSAWEIGSITMSAAGVTTGKHHVAQDAAGFHVLLGAGSAAKWRTVMSRTAATFGDNAFWWAGMGGAQGPYTRVNSTSTLGTVETATGPRAAVVVSAKYSNLSDRYATIYIEERRTEYYVEGIGLVRSEWFFNKNDRDPYGIDESTTGKMQLKNVDVGPFLELIDEREPNESVSTAQALAMLSLVRGDVAVGDTSGILASRPGNLPVHDVFAFNLPQAGQVQVSLALGGSPADLDLIVLSNDGLVREIRANGPGRDELLQRDLPAGQYFLGVVAKGSVTDRCRYTLSLRPIAAAQ